MTSTYSNPGSFYDILPNDYWHLSYTLPANASSFEFNTGAGPSFYPTPTVAMIRGPTPTFPSPIYNGVSPSQYPPSLTDASTSSESSTSPVSPSTLPSGPSDYFPTAPYLGSETDHPPPATTTSRSRKRKADKLDPNPDSTSVKDEKGKKKKRSGTGYGDMMERLPPRVQEALMQDYPGCCDQVNRKDNSAVYKHRFSKTHFARLPQELQHELPAFICPAFLAMHPGCPSAKAGRYDSTERHGKKCPGYLEMKQTTPVRPVEITKNEFKAVLAFRRPCRPRPSVAAAAAEDRGDPDVESAVKKLLKVLVTSALEASKVDSKSGVSNNALAGDHGARKAEELNRDVGSDDEESWF